MAEGVLSAGIDRQFLDSNGNPLAGAHMVFYAHGTTSRRAVYSDWNMTVPLAQPIILDEAGRLPPNLVWFDPEDPNGYDAALYRVVGRDPITGSEILEIVWTQQGLPGTTDINSIISSLTAENTVANLKFYRPDTDDKVYTQVGGYFLSGDGGGGVFWWDSTSTEEEDLGYIFNPGGEPTGRWKRMLYTGSQIHSAWWGAFGHVVNGLEQDVSVQWGRMMAFAVQYDREIYADNPFDKDGDGNTPHYWFSNKPVSFEQPVIFGSDVIFKDVSEITGNRASTVINDINKHFEWDYNEFPYPEMFDYHLDARWFDGATMPTILDTANHYTLVGDWKTSENSSGFNFELHGTLTLQNSFVLIRKCDFAARSVIAGSNVIVSDSTHHNVSYVNSTAYDTDHFQGYWDIDTQGAIFTFKKSTLENYKISGKAIMQAALTEGSFYASHVANSGPTQALVISGNAVLTVDDMATDLYVSTNNAAVHGVGMDVCSLAGLSVGQGGNTSISDLNIDGLCTVATGGYWAHFSNVAFQTAKITRGANTMLDMHRCRFNLGHDVGTSDICTECWAFGDITVASPFTGRFESNTCMSGLINGPEMAAEGGVVINNKDTGHTIAGSRKDWGIVAGPKSTKGPWKMLLSPDWNNPPDAPSGSGWDGWRGKFVITPNTGEQIGLISEAWTGKVNGLDAAIGLATQSSPTAPCLRLEPNPTQTEEGWRFTCTYANGLTNAYIKDSSLGSGWKLLHSGFKSCAFNVVVSFDLATVKVNGIIYDTKLGDVGFIMSDFQKDKWVWGYCLMGAYTEMCDGIYNETQSGTWNRPGNVFGSVVMVNQIGSTVLKSFDKFMEKFNFTDEFGKTSAAITTVGAARYALIHEADKPGW
jgi:hypothetical protein